MKAIQNYSINVRVLEEFNMEVKPQTRSRLIEALMVEFLIKYSGEKSPDISSSRLTEKESTIG